jgi:hypothetical protein
MALYYELPVYRDTYRWVLRIHEITREFPRDFKYTLGQDMRRDALTLVRCLYRANKSRERVEPLEAFLDHFELLKMELRLCGDMKLMSIKNQAELGLMMDGIGKQVTGWRNASR